MKRNVFVAAISLLITVAVVFSFVSINAEAASLDSIKTELKNAGFPDDYAEILAPIKQQHPNWVFEPLDTQKNFDDAVAAESKEGICTISKDNSEDLLLSKNFGTYYSSGNFNYKLIDGSYVTASPLAVSYFMDPRNFIGDLRTIFQFENNGYTDKVSYDDQVSAVKSIIKNTFMDPSKTDKDYASIISKAGRTYGVNPCYLASKILQEVGTNGSASVSGTYPGYEGYYNFFNIGATSDGGSGDAVAKGLDYAKRATWNTPEKAINGGTEIIAKTYIGKGQSTSYLTKFNVNPATKQYYPEYTHQYMTAVFDPAQSAKTTYNGYVSAGTLDQLRTFLIPVYNNMPSFSTTSVKFNDSLSTIKFDSTVNVRSTASITGSVAFQVGSGDTVTIIDRVRSVDRATSNALSHYQIRYPFWYKIKTSSGKTGYVSYTTVDTVASLYMKVGTHRQFGYSLSPNTQSAVRFMSLDPRIATVDLKTGMINAISTGTTQIVAYTASGSVDYFNLTVGTSSNYPENGWYKEDGLWYYNVDSSPVTGWQKISGKWYYFRMSGAMATGWTKVDSKWYYMNSDGEMQTGWLSLGGEMYYLYSDGSMAVGWAAVDGYWYYFNSDGEKQTGWIKVDGKLYHLNEHGAMEYGWKYISGKWYYLGTDGAAAVGWSKIDGKNYYMNSDGSMATGHTLVDDTWYFFDKEGNILTGWQQENGIWYYMNDEGHALVGWSYIDGAWYYMNSDGAMQTGWKSIGGKWYYMTAYGKMVTGWGSIGGRWYYFNTSGVMVTGWGSIGGKWYYFSSSGAMVTGWGSIGGKWYYFSSSGAMVTGWGSIGGKWYYFNSSGAMLTGWQAIGGKWYYFSSNGAMVTGTQRINGRTYRFNQSGVWIA